MKVGTILFRIAIVNRMPPLSFRADAFIDGTGPVFAESSPWHLTIACGRRGRFPRAGASRTTPKCSRRDRPRFVAMRPADGVAVSAIMA